MKIYKTEMMPTFFLKLWTLCMEECSVDLSPVLNRKYVHSAGLLRRKLG